MIDFEIEFEPPEKLQYIGFKGGNHEQFWKDWDREICRTRFRPPKPWEKDILNWEKMHKA